MKNTVSNDVKAFLAAGGKVQTVATETKLTDKSYFNLNRYGLNKKPGKNGDKNDDK